ncbi:MAG: hypothetical protein JOY54_20160 [Acidobacteriaceae bacterium]|nr:hypothetical protein [Acidobacteriaceae bacterium]
MSSSNALYQRLAAESSGTSSGSNSAQAGGNGTDALANQSTFLQLLVAQLKNQDPTQPVDGTTFVTQLAEFSDVEQNLAMRQDLDAISRKYDGTSSLTSGSTATQSGGSTQDEPNGTSGTNSNSAIGGAA